MIGWWLVQGDCNTTEDFGGWLRIPPYFAGLTCVENVYFLNQSQWLEKSTQTHEKSTRGNLIFILKKHQENLRKTLFNHPEPSASQAPTGGDGRRRYRTVARRHWWQVLGLTIFSVVEWASHASIYIYIYIDIDPTIWSPKYMYIYICVYIYICIYMYVCAHVQILQTYRYRAIYIWKKCIKTLSNRPTTNGYEDMNRLISHTVAIPGGETFPNASWNHTVIAW